MSAPPNYLREIQKWWHSPLAKAALVLGVGVHLAGFLAFRVIIEPAAAQAAPPPFIQWNGSSTGALNPVLREQALLLDSEPLFLPTALNTRSVNSALRQATPGQALLAAVDDPNIIAYADWDNGGKSVTNTQPMTVYRLLRRYARDSLSTFGQAPAAPPAANSSYAEVLNFNSGDSLGTFALDTGETLPAVSSGPELLEFALYRTNTGSVGSLLPLSPAASEAAGQAWATIVERAKWVTTLPEGYYRIVVSP